MKLAWLCYYEEGDEPEIKFERPDGYYWKVVPIVYAEIVPQGK